MDNPEHIAYIEDAYRTLQGLRLTHAELEKLAEVLRHAAAQADESPERVAAAIRKEAPKAAVLEPLFISRDGGETWTSVQGLAVVLTTLIQLVQVLREAEPAPTDRIINKIRVQSQQPAPQPEVEADPAMGCNNNDPT